MNDYTKIKEKTLPRKNTPFEYLLFLAAPFLIAAVVMLLWFFFTPKAHAEVITLYYEPSGSSNWLGNYASWTDFGSFDMQESGDLQYMKFICSNSADNNSVNIQFQLRDSTGASVLDTTDVQHWRCASNESATYNFSGTYHVSAGTTYKLYIQSSGLPDNTYFFQYSTTPSFHLSMAMFGDDGTSSTYVNILFPQDTEGVYDFDNWNLAFRVPSSTHIVVKYSADPLFGTGVFTDSSGVFPEDASTTMTIVKPSYKKLEEYETYYAFATVRDADENVIATSPVISFNILPGEVNPAFTGTGLEFVYPSDAVDSSIAPFTGFHINYSENLTSGNYYMMKALWSKKYSDLADAPLPVGNSQSSYGMKADDTNLNTWKAGNWTSWLQTGYPTIPANMSSGVWYAKLYLYEATSSFTTPPAVVPSVSNLIATSTIIAYRIDSGNAPNDNLPPQYSGQPFDPNEYTTCGSFWDDNNAGEYVMCHVQRFLNKTADRMNNFVQEKLGADPYKKLGLFPFKTIDDFQSVISEASQNSDTQQDIVLAGSERVFGGRSFTILSSTTLDQFETNANYDLRGFMSKIIYALVGVYIIMLAVGFIVIIKKTGNA